MVIYRDISSLEMFLGASAKMLYTLSNQRVRHYHNVKIPKGNGEYRELCVPDKFLKAVQKKIALNLLEFEPISLYAKAYRRGSSTLKNAEPHVGKPVLLKMDIRQFFDRITYPMIKEKVFSAEKYSEANRILLSLLCVHKDALPQGAPTSPVISNIIMRDFDNTVGAWCEERHIAYTRYCDDMTFSGNFDPVEVKRYVKRQLRAMGFFPNDKKTVVARDGQKQTVTGVVVNDRPNISVTYRKKLRQELYYCKTYGVSSHIARIGVSVNEDTYLRQLLGRVNHALSVDSLNEEMRGYKAWLRKQLSFNGVM